MKTAIESFESLQKAVLGFVQYKVRGKTNEWFVDAHSRLGRYIKVKVSRQPEEVVREWIESYSKILNDMR